MAMMFIRAQELVAARGYTDGPRWVPGVSPPTYLCPGSPRLCRIGGGVPARQEYVLQLC